MREGSVGQGCEVGVMELVRVGVRARHGGKDVECHICFIHRTVY